VTSSLDVEHPCAVLLPQFAEFSAAAAATFGLCSRRFADQSELNAVSVQTGKRSNKPERKFYRSLRHSPKVSNS